MQYDKIFSYIEAGKQQGAKAVLGGEKRPGKGYFVDPTIFVDVKPDMKIVRDEIFGPVLAVAKFSTEEEAIELANDTSYGLGAGLHSSTFRLMSLSAVPSSPGYLRQTRMLRTSEPGASPTAGAGKRFGVLGAIDPRRCYAHADDATAQPMRTSSLPLVRVIAGDITQLHGLVSEPNGHGPITNPRLFVDDASQCMRVSQALEAGTVSRGSYQASRAVESLFHPRCWTACPDLQNEHGNPASWQAVPLRCNGSITLARCEAVVPVQPY
ncbi:hypothetical protein NUW54_g8566 [Trametes sanguinea]|uniref:Uncharacterized protein n=1 Tax=Trametes sanguinea TaxID=158606 RepID=A0ACC1PCI0_9APHY|nr:hypothetical protein NUW54_g8566 [Trametes sanguinea]